MRRSAGASVSNRALPSSPSSPPESTARIDANNAAPTSAKSPPPPPSPPKPPAAPAPAAAAAAASRDATLASVAAALARCLPNPFIPARPNISATASTVSRSVAPPGPGPSANDSFTRRFKASCAASTTESSSACDSAHAQRPLSASRLMMFTAVASSLAPVARSITAERMGTTSERTASASSPLAHAPTDATALPMIRGDTSVVRIDVAAPDWSLDSISASDWSLDSSGAPNRSLDSISARRAATVLAARCLPSKSDANSNAYDVRANASSS